jgi:hypothetical protein
MLNVLPMSPKSDVAFKIIIGLKFNSDFKATLILEGHKGDMGRTSSITLSSLLLGKLTLVNCLAHPCNSCIFSIY